MENKDFREFGHRVVDWVADYFENIEKYAVLSRVKPGAIKARLPLKPPAQGESMESILADFEDIVLPGITHWQHPGWFGYFPANNSPASVLAEILTAGIGAQCMVWQTSPAATELEDRVLDWLRQMIGLPEGFAGVIQDTASTATLCALLSAREKATGFTSNEHGFASGLTVYASDQAHSSIEKGVKMAGYGRDQLRMIPTDDTYAMIPEKLEEAIAEDEKKGLKPACVVATIGTTSSTAVDPLAAIGRICRLHDTWLHVDAAYGGSACLLAEMRWLLEGAELMDSFVMNPHKWLFTNFDCSAYFVKDPGLLIRTFEIHPEYLKTGADAHVKNYRDWGIQLGRRFRALKLWFVVRSYGTEGLQALIREHIRLSRLFRRWVEEHPMFEPMAPTPFSLVCFRFNGGKDDAALNAFNKDLLERVNASGRVFLTHTTLRGRYVLRMAIGQRTTRERHVREAWEIIVRSAEALLKA
ncbi:MAG: aspartate aminotransferase family protein [Candidatus Aminicenantes bacterium]|nr:aspartate aminotransferase family protein [Candidatus Aminicenantes bacterium]